MRCTELLRCVVGKSKNRSFEICLEGVFARQPANIGLLKTPKPNLPAVWRSLRSAGMVGTIDSPRAGEGAGVRLLSGAKPLRYD